MRFRFPVWLLMISFGMALLFAGLFFHTSSAGSMELQTTTVPAIPTLDRLAQPTLPAEPSDADRGAQVYWLSCMPCHGDTGQGLTAEFRQTYPAEEQNCWQSGCHGKRPYDQGFTIPEYIPPLIGERSLQRFPNALILKSYIFAAMPYWKPASLSEEETWQVTAFLLRENDLWDGPLTESNVASIQVGLQPVTPTPTPVPASLVNGYSPIMAGVMVVILMAVVVLGFQIPFLRKRWENRKTGR